MPSTAGSSEISEGCAIAAGSITGTPYPQVSRAKSPPVAVSAAGAAEREDEEDDGSLSGEESALDADTAGTAKERAEAREDGGEGATEDVGAEGTDADEGEDEEDAAELREEDAADETDDEDGSEEDSTEDDASDEAAVP